MDTDQTAVRASFAAGNGWQNLFSRLRFMRGLLFSRDVRLDPCLSVCIRGSKESSESLK
jgi:hypothetical protein